MKKTKERDDLKLKKLVAIIFVLLVIFIGMYIYQKQEKQNIVTAEEVSSIEEYISKIYMWKEVTGEALPIFENIDNAPEKWIWETVKKNLDDYDEIVYEQIQDKVEELFGSNFTKKFPQEGNESFIYNQEQNTYEATNIELDSDNDTFLLNKIQKTKQGYEVEIVEYIEDYSEETETDTEEEAEFTIHIKNINGEEIVSVKNTEGKDKIVEQVKKNIDKFSKKTIELEKSKDNSSLSLVQVKQ